MPHLFVLFEHAAGYALFKSSKYKDIAKLRKDIQSNLDDLERFQEIMKFVAFNPFKNTRHALENMQDIANGSVNEDLKTFLENHISKKDKYVIGVNDKQLGSSLTALGYTCSADGAVHDLIRGIRTYFHNLIEGFEDASEASKSQLGLGHYYSRSRVKFNVNRVDNMIIQSISLLDQLDKDINTFVMRVREWYSLHFPELLQIVPENTVFIQCVHVIKNRKDIDGLEEELENVLHDSSKVQKIMVLARSSMGMDIGGPDLENVYHFVDRIIALSQKRKEILEYLKAKMSNVAPNLAALIGDVVGARLIAHSGSLTNLAKAPASTVQILGAEKALFRALKTRGNTPKFGLLFHTRYIAKAAKQNKGRISRYLANKCSVACRIDCFRDNPTNVFGETLKDLVENRLKFYETGEIPPKNVDVMSKAVDKVNVYDEELKAEKELQDKAEKKQQEKAAKKAKKKLQKSMESSFEMNGTNEALDNHIDDVQTPEIRKKKKSKGKTSDAGEMNESIENAVEEVEIPEIRKKKKKKSKGKLSDAGEMNETVEDAIEEEDATVKKKKRKLQESSFEVEEEMSPKKKKKSKHLF